MTASGATTQIGARRNRDRPGWPVVVAFMAVGTVLGLVGRTTLLPQTEFATVWPSAGVAVLWLLVRRASLLSIDTALLFGSSLAFAMLSGLPDWVAWVLAPAHTLQTVVVVALLRRWLPDLWGCGGRRALDSPRSLAVYLACIAGGVLASAVPVGIVWVTMGDPDAGMDVLLWMGATSAESSWSPPRGCCCANT